MKTFFSLYVASLKEMARDRMALFWTLAFPVLFIFLFGTIFSGGGPDTFEVGLADQDGGPASQGIAKAFGEVDALEITTGSEIELLEKVREGDLRVVVVLPAGLSASLEQGRPVNVPVHYDPSNQTTSTIVLPILFQVLQRIDRGLSGAPQLLQVEPVSVVSEGLRNIDFFVPGILAMAIMQIGLFGTAIPIVSLREQQVLRRLGATPLPRLTLLASQVALRLTMALIQAVLLLGVGIVVYDLQMIGSWLALSGFVLLGAAMMISLGYVIAAVSRTQESVTGLTSILNFPMMFLSGIFFPIELVPAWLSPAIKAIPLTYLGDALRQVMVDAPGSFSLATDALVLAAWLAVCTLISVRFFHWE